MTSSTLYFIKKDDYYLTSMMPINFGHPFPDAQDCYWYHCKAIATDIAYQLDAFVDEFIVPHDELNLIISRKKVMYKK